MSRGVAGKTSFKNQLAASLLAIFNRFLVVNKLSQAITYVGLLITSLLQDVRAHIDIYQL